MDMQIQLAEAISSGATKNEIEEIRSLALESKRTLTPAIWQMISQMAPVMHQSRLFGVNSVEQATAIMLKGYELGLSITASFEFVQVVQGKPGLSPRGALALLHNSYEIEKINIEAIYKDNKYFGHKCYMKRRNGFEYAAQFTLDDARRAGLLKPDSGWEKYPENMCMWRAVGFCADIVAPDITGGMTGIMKMPEAMNVALNGSGDIINVEMVPVPSNTEQQSITLENLCNQYGAEAIMQANEGKIPQSQSELEMVAKKLGGG